MGMDFRTAAPLAYQQNKELVEKCKAIAARNRNEDKNYR